MSPTSIPISKAVTTHYRSGTGSPSTPPSPTGRQQPYLKEPPPTGSPSTPGSPSSPPRTRRHTWPNSDSPLRTYSLPQHQQTAILIKAWEAAVEGALEEGLLTLDE